MRKQHHSKALGIASGIVCAVLATTAVMSKPVLASDYSEGPDGERTSRISDESVSVVDTSNFPKRPRRLELGPPFIGSGPLPEGWEIPGGFVVNPAFLVYGVYRTALQTYKNPATLGNDSFSEWANSLSVFGNLQLSYVNRILIGMQPLQDRRGGVGQGPPVFSSYNFEPESSPTGDEGWQNEFNSKITTLFFEGDLGELIPKADFNDFESLDLGIAVGRQPLFIQEGLLIFDTIDSVGIIRNNILPPGGSNLQMTFLYGWNEINRADNRDPGNLDMYALLLAADYPNQTLALNLVYVDASQGPDIPNPAAADDPTAPAMTEAPTSDGFHWGANTTQRIGHYNTAFHVLGSHALDDTPPPLPGRPVPAVSDGYLLFSEISTELPWTEDNVWLNLYWGIDEYSPAARGPTVGGPLGRAGLLYASQGLGRYLLALNNQGQDVVGFSLGYQHFLRHSHRQQIVYEVGGRQSTLSGGPAAGAGMIRYQRGIGQHTVWEVSGFGLLVDEGSDTADARAAAGMEALDGTGYGARTEIRYNF